MIKEIIQENISLSRHNNDMMRSMTNSIVELVKALSKQFDTRYFEPALKTEDTNQFFYKSIELINKFLNTYTEQYILNGLTKTVSDITSKQTRVDFDQIDTGAHVDKNENIILNEEYSRIITDGIKENFSQLFINTWDNTIGYDNIKDFIDTLPQNVNNLYYLLGKNNSINLTYTFKVVSSVLIHECVHILQNVPQKDKVKQKLLKMPEYRSYLQKDFKSFIDAINNLKKDQSGFRLYKSSPQEITAMAHDIVISIVDQFNWDNYADPSKIVIDPSDIVTRVNDHLKMANIYPTTKTEKMVYKRYMKLIYLELVKYRNWLISQKKR